MNKYLVKFYEDIDYPYPMYISEVEADTPEEALSKATRFYLDNAWWPAGTTREQKLKELSYHEVKEIK